MKTFEEILKAGVEGYSFRDVLDNLTDEQIKECADQYASQSRVVDLPNIVSAIGQIWHDKAQHGIDKNV